jgi:hypothetical protein
VNDPSPLYQRMTSLSYKMGVVGDRVARIRRVVNTEQLIEAAQAQTTVRVSKRVKFWTDLVRQYGAVS